MRINGLVWTLDPNGECVFNISKETTRKELLKIEGVTETTRRMQGINLSGGHTNAVEVTCELFHTPTLDTLLAAFLEDTCRTVTPTPQEGITHADTTGASA